MSDRLLKFMIVFGGVLVGYEWLDKDGNWKYVKTTKITDVIPKTLNHQLERYQYTGLKDIEGNEIYECHELQNKPEDTWTVGFASQGLSNSIAGGWVLAQIDANDNCAMCFGWESANYKIISHTAIVKGRKLKIQVKTHKPKKGKRRKGLGIVK